MRRRITQQIRRMTMTLRQDIGSGLDYDLLGVLDAIQTSCKIISRSTNRAGIDKMIGTPGMSPLSSTRVYFLRQVFMTSEARWGERVFALQNLLMAIPQPSRLTCGMGTRVRWWKIATQQHGCIVLTAKCRFQQPPPDRRKGALGPDGTPRAINLRALPPHMRLGPTPPLPSTTLSLLCLALTLPPAPPQTRWFPRRAWLERCTYLGRSGELVSAYTLLVLLPTLLKQSYASSTIRFARSQVRRPKLC